MAELMALLSTRMIPSSSSRHRRNVSMPTWKQEWSKGRGRGR